MTQQDAMIWMPMHLPKDGKVRHRVLVTTAYYSRYCTQGLEWLVDNGCAVHTNELGRRYTQEELAGLVSGIDGLVSNLEYWDEAMFCAAPHLKVIARFGAGYDTIDLAAAGRHKVVVANAPGLNASAVAEHAICLFMSLLRNIPALNEQARKGGWERHYFPELPGKTFGILGFGKIGQGIAQKIAGLGMRCIAYDSVPDADIARQLDVRLCSQEEVLRQSDYLSLNLPLLPETRHLIGRETIARMKDGAMVINTSRGALVDEAAADEALEAGKLGGMATDVFESEPVRPDYLLFRHRNFIATPHCAGETYNSYQRIGLANAQAVVAALEQKKVENRLV